MGMRRNPEDLFELSPAAPDISAAPMLLYLEGLLARQGVLQIVG